MGVFGSDDGSLGQGIAWIFAGYLVGSAVAEVLTPQRRAAGAIHAAALAVRQPNHLLPIWAWVLPWLFLLPCLACPLLLLGDHPAGITRVRDHTGSAMARSYWFTAPALVTIAVIAGAGLLAWLLVLRRLARRRLPIDSPGGARLDVLTRALSARALSGAAASLGMSLLGGLAYLSSQAVMSRTCAAPQDCHYRYAWHARYELLQTGGFLALAAAVLIFWFSRLPRIDPSKMQSVVGSST